MHTFYITFSSDTGRCMRVGVCANTVDEAKEKFLRETHHTNVSIQVVDLVVH